MLINNTDFELKNISVCVLTANRVELLGRLLNAVITQLRPGDEVVIFDTNPSVHNAKLIEGFNSAQLVYAPQKIEPFDFATARNALLQKATKEIAVFIDDDAIPFPGWLEQVRTNLAAHAASGGVTVSCSQLPDWWDPGINWCIGLSPPGTVLGQPGFYPDTCNLGAVSPLWKAHPLCSVARERHELYATGREDAEWWKDRRLHGDDAIVSYRQAVVHEIHSDRLTLKYIVGRAQLDGQSSWLRRSEFETATAIPWDFVHIVGVFTDKFIRHPLCRQKWVNDYIWLNRQLGLFRAVWQSNLPLRPRHRSMVKELGKALAFQGQIRAGKLAFNFIKHSRAKSGFPSTNPDKVFVSADCLMGDSILLRPHINNLAKTFPATEVIVSAKSPQLLAGLPANVHVLLAPEASEYTRKNISRISAAFVPYFHEGDYSLWRKELAPVGSTFDCDVGFCGRRDYIFARRQIPKDLELHEHENLARLFRLWELVNAGHPVPPPVPPAGLEWLDSQGVAIPYILVQFGAGYASKEWPLDYWIPFLRILGKETALPILIIGTSQWAEAADTAAQELAPDIKCHGLVGKTTLEQVMALVSKAAFFIGGCSGPKHLAMDYRVPTFTLYTATEPHRWGASRDHELHAYVTALPQKLTGMELQCVRDEHRPRLLRPEYVAEKALFHYNQVMRQG